MFGDLWFEDYVKKGNDIWFAAGNYNGVYKFNTISKEVKRIATFPGEPMTKDWAFRRIKLWEDKLVFMPVYADSVFVLDTKSEVLERFSILEENELIVYQHKCKFQCYEIYGDWLYIIGSEYPGIIKVNLKDHQVIKLADIPEMAYSKSIEGYFGNEIVVKESILYITCPSSNRILLLDMRTDCFEEIEVGSRSNRYNGIREIEDAYYLKVCDNDNLIRWDQKDGSCREIVLEFNIHFYDRKICRTQNYLWVFSYFTNEVYRMNHKGECISKILLDHSENRVWLVFCEETPEGIYFLNLNSGSWHFLKEDGTDEDLHFIMKEPDKGIIEHFLMDSQIKNWIVLEENYTFPVELLLLKIFEEEKEKKKEKLGNDFGKRIYENIRGKM